MAATRNDPRLLYSINNIRAFHVQNGQETEITPSPQTLSLLMVPTTSSYQDGNGGNQQEGSEEEDFYLHLHMPSELDMPLPATTQIYHQPPDSYLIPRWDLGPQAGAFLRLKFPSIGSRPDQVTQEDVDTFETILAQCTAFLERAPPPPTKGGSSTGGYAPYDPSAYAPGEGYISPSGQPARQSGHIVLVDEADGSVVGELSEGYQVVEDPGVKPGSKKPVEITLPAEGNKISVANVSDDYLRLAQHPAYKKSTLVQTSAMASRLVVTGSNMLANALASGANSFAQKTKPRPKPVSFSPAARERIRKINTFSESAASLSSKTVGQVGKIAQDFGASLARRKDRKYPRGFDENGNPVPFKPGILNKSMIAFTTLVDGIEYGARTVLQTGSAAASTIVGHRYGPEAGAVAQDLTGGFKNVGLVYIDAAGVSRKAILKSVAKGMIIGRMHNGQQVMVGSGDGGVVTSSDIQGMSSNQQLGVPGPSGNPYHRAPSPARRTPPPPTPPPPYGAPNTYSLGGTPMNNSGKR